MKTINKDDLYCHYSDLPSPMAYVKNDCMDYDSMGDCGRFPKVKKTKFIGLFDKIKMWFKSKK